MNEKLAGCPVPRGWEAHIRRTLCPEGACSWRCWSWHGHVGWLTINNAESSKQLGGVSLRAPIGMVVQFSGQQLPLLGPHAVV